MRKTLNQRQIDMLTYMKEVVNQEDLHFFEAWKLVEYYVLEALEDVEDEEQKLS